MSGSAMAARAHFAQKRSPQARRTISTPMRRIRSVSWARKIMNSRPVHLPLTIDVSDAKVNKLPRCTVSGKPRAVTIAAQHRSQLLSPYPGTLASSGNAACTQLRSLRRRPFRECSARLLLSGMHVLVGFGSGSHLEAKAVRIEEVDRLDEVMISHPEYLDASFL